MIELDRDNKNFILKNNETELKVCYKDTLQIVHLNNLLSTLISNKNLELFIITFKSKIYSSKDFTVTDVNSSNDDYFELITILMKNEDIGLSLRVNFLSDSENLQIILQFKDSQKDGLSHRIVFHSPFLECFNYSDDDKVFYPKMQKQNCYGKNFIRPMKETFLASDIKLPLVVTDKENKLGFSLSFPFLSDLIDEGSAQNRNVSFYNIENENDLKKHQIKLACDNSFNDSVVFQINSLRNGFNEAFEKARDNFQKNYDFSEYKKNDLQWFSSCCVHAFAFLYGDNCYDAKNLKIDVDKIIERGNKFGGFDTVTLWHEYPRLGVDERSQWQFYDEIHGGREEFKRAINEFHKNGIKVFIPYIPWDNTTLGTKVQAKELAKLVGDIGADGVQLDTLDSLSEIFREELNKVSKGIVLTSQKHPAKKRPLEMITTSWDEFFYSDFMPQVDILRFFLPFHLSPALSRWDRVEEKNELIDYTIFSAEPIVIFEDVFGRDLSYSVEQQQRIKDYKQVYLKYRQIYQCLNPVPLYPTVIDTIYCNLFIDKSSNNYIVSLYNESEIDYKGKAIKISDLQVTKAKELIGTTSPIIIDNFLDITIKAKQVAHILLN